ncbi:MFS transporter [Actinoplanes derwentensis]|uniref:Predicted arabinose efflux permease, MFS family n=1 Tax=Actinoplanes derwentensis TaxID=113562 RepID=A0A1H2CRR8_9ACTN|nr:MFS transporter [Actinoplanes derwentensis]GID85463.1 MFS transporter [Actinoplanes derwentensis]SDT73218.1 Predicted arabinose efflux permease, MFS family [Actinoplanes derwentensis]
MKDSLAALRSTPYRFLLAGRTINALGNSFAPIALAFAVLDLTGSARDLGLVVGTRTLANVIFLLFGGVLADRLPRHLMMVGSNVAAAVTQAAVAALVLTGAATIPLLVLLSVLNGVASAMALPASAALLPMTVPENVRLQAIALSRIVLNGAMVLGAPAAGVVVAATDPGVGIAVDAVTFVVAAFCFAAVRVAVPARSGPRSHVLADLRTGWSEFRSRTWLWAVVAGFSLLNAAWSGGLYVLGPTVADQTVGRPAWGLVLAAETAGLVLGGLLAIRLRLRRLLFVGVVSCFGMALPLFVLGVYPQLWALFLAMFVAGLMLEQFGVAWETTVQEHVPADRLARVYSYDMVGSFAAIPLGQVAIGPIAEVAGLRATLIGTGVAVVVAVLGMLASRDVRTLRHRLPEDEPGTMKESVT